MGAFMENGVFEAPWHDHMTTARPIDVGGMGRPRAARAGVWRPLARGHLGVAGFTWATLFCCLVLQRFAFPAGGSLKISIATPLVLGLAVWALACGTLVIERRRMALYFGLCAVAAFSVGTQMNLPLAIAPRSSVTSLAYWLAITAFATLRFRAPVAEGAFLRTASLAFQVVAVAGLLQFVLQFAGIRLFEFTGIVPDRFLIEDQYAVTIPMGFGLNRSNGFFLVEPSVFSQVMALGIVCEALSARRPSRFALLFAGLVVSVSGTGWMVLGSFIVVLGVASGIRGLLGALLMAAAGALAFAALSVTLPDVAESMASRLTEFTLPGTSGHERFVTPFLALQSVLMEAPWALFTGVGPGGSEQLAVPYFYRLNTPVKVLMEYGILGLGFYVALLLRAERPHAQALLTAPAMVLLLITGGYHQFSPILFLICLLCSVAYLRPGTSGVKT